MDMIFNVHNLLILNNKNLKNAKFDLQSFSEGEKATFLGISG